MQLISTLAALAATISLGVASPVAVTKVNAIDKRQS